MVARDLTNKERTVTRTRIVLHPDASLCSLVLRNRGVIVNGNSATFFFAGVGATSQFFCGLDQSKPTECESFWKQCGVVAKLFVWEGGLTDTVYILMSLLLLHNEGLWLALWMHVMTWHIRYIPVIKTWSYETCWCCANWKFIFRSNSALTLNTNVTHINAHNSPLEGATQLKQASLDFSFCFLKLVHLPIIIHVHASFISYA